MAVRRRVLIGAYACEPHSGSEPAVGWNWALQAAKAGNDVHVVTRKNNRKTIEAELDQHPVPSLTFHFLDLPRPLLWIKRRTGTLGLLGYYYIWQLALRRLAKQLHKLHSFDLVHHVTFANDWLPSGLAGIGPPFVWGPIGGSSHTVPAGYSTKWSRKARAYERTRTILQKMFLLFDPLLRLTTSRAVVALPYTEEAYAVLPQRLRGRSQVMTHIGINPDPGAQRAKPGQGSTIKVVTGGRLVHWKGFDLLIEALAHNYHSEASSTRLVVTGDGPARQSLENLTREIGVEPVVQFTGRLPSVADVRETLLGADVYALLTLRDGPPVAVLEAMYAGLPILYLDLGAPSELVPPDAGFGVEVGTRQETIEGVAAALRNIEADPSQLSAMGAVGFSHAVDVHSWDTIGHQIASVYDHIDPPDSS